MLVIIVYARARVHLSTTNPVSHSCRCSFSGLRYQIFLCSWKYFEGWLQPNTVFLCWKLLSKEWHILSFLCNNFSRKWVKMVILLASRIMCRCVVGYSLWISQWKWVWFHTMFHPKHRKNCKCVKNGSTCDLTANRKFFLAVPHKYDTSNLSW